MDWAGEFVFGRAGAAFRGSSADNSAHAHATLQLAVSDSEPVKLEQPDGSIVVGHTVLVRPGVLHRLHPIALVTLLFLEPQTAAARRLLDRAGVADVAVIDRPMGLIDSDMPLGATLAAVEFSGDTDDADPRVERALAFLSSARGPRPVSRAAAHVGISPARLRALAQAHLDTPLTAWLAWRRLERAGQALAAGASIAEAAVDAGFADQAHLSRATRQVFGITPGTAGGVVRPQAIASRPY